MPASAWLGPSALALAFVVYYAEVLVGARLVSAADLVDANYAPYTLTAPSGFEPSNRALADSVVSLGPAMSFVRASLATGQLPLWNPYTEFGMPFFAQSQWGMLSPVQVPFLLPASLYSIETAQTLVGMLKVAVAGTGAYVFGRAMKLSVGASVFAGIVWMFGGYTTGWLSMPASSVAIFLPWICFGVEAALTGQRPWFASAGLATVLAASVAGGHPEVLLYTMGAVLLYALVRVAQQRHELAGQWRMRLGALALAVVLALGISAVILLPAAELFFRSVDSEQRELLYSNMRLGPENLLQIFDPDANGTRNERGPDYSALAAPWYAGVITALLALGAFASRDRRAVPFLAMLLAALVIAMNAPPWQLLVEVFPVLGGIPKWAPLLLWAFGLAMAGAVGADRLEQLVRRRASPRRLAPAVAALACLIAFLELYAWGHDYNPRVPRDRVSVSPPPNADVLPHGGHAQRTAFLGRRTLPFLLPMGFEIPEVRSYGQPTREDYDLFMRTVVTDLGNLYATDVGYAITAPRENALPVLSAANVGYAAYSNGNWRLRDFVPLRDGPLKVQRNLRVEPRAYVVNDFLVEPDLHSAMRRVARKGFDPRRQVVLDQAPAGIETTSSAQRTKRGPPGVITRYDNNLVEVDVESKQPGILVISDSIYPGWKAEIDGKASEMLRANGLFRAVAVTPGRHKVVFSYRPMSVLVAAAISLVAVLATALLAFLGRRRRWQPNP